MRYEFTVFKVGNQYTIALQDRDLERVYFEDMNNAVKYIIGELTLKIKEKQLIIERESRLIDRLSREIARLKDYEGGYNA